MAATYTLTSPKFPDGTTVYANPVNPPAVAPVAAVVIDGSVTFNDLRELEDYVAHATIGTPDADGAGATRVQVTFTTDGGPEQQEAQDLPAFARRSVAMLAQGMLEGDLLVHLMTGTPTYGTMAWPDGSLGTFVATDLSSDNEHIDSYTVSFRAFGAPTGVTEWRPTAGFEPLDDAEATTLVERCPEVRAAHAERNVRVPTDAELAAFYAARPSLLTDNTENPYNRLVTGRHGLSNPTTDELIQWASHKWGIPTDRVRAQMVQESGWDMGFLGDLVTQPDEAHYSAAPEYARVPNTLNVYESLGISQLRWYPDKVGNTNPHPGTEPLRWMSTAFNLDYYGSVVRFYFDDPEGRRTNWGDGSYEPGSEWLSQGGWYLPFPWDNEGQQNYVEAVQGRLAARPWLLAEFSDVTSNIRVLTQAAITRSENGSILTRPPIVESDYVPPDPPGPPTDVEISAANESIILDWEPPADDGGAPIVRYRITNVEFGWTLDTGYEGQRPYTLTGLENGIALSFTISAIGATGLVGEPSEPSDQATPTAPTVPGAPTSVGGTPGNARANLSWTAPASTGGSAITAYRITPSIAGVAQSPVTTPTSATSYAVTGLTNDTAYTFVVAAINAVGTGTNSTASSAITPAPPPGFEVPPEMPLFSAGLATAASNEDFFLSSRMVDDLPRTMWGSVYNPTTMAPQWGAVNINSVDGADKTEVAVQIENLTQPRYIPGGSLGQVGGSSFFSVMRDYKLQGHTSSSGTCPTDADGGWVDLVTVTDNRRSVRLHETLDLSTYGWFKVRVTAINSATGVDGVAFQLQMRDVQDGWGDSILVYGDSISNETWGFQSPLADVWPDNGASAVIEDVTSRTPPLITDYSTGGWTAVDGDTNKETYLGGMPHEIWVFGFCHNDAHAAGVDLGTLTPAGASSTYALAYKTRLQSLIDYAVSQGAVRVVIPLGTFTNNGDYDEPNTVFLNTIISDLADENEGVVQVGPDLHTLLDAGDLRDAIHPTVPGYELVHTEWAEWLEANVYT